MYVHIYSVLSMRCCYCCYIVFVILLVCIFLVFKVVRSLVVQPLWGFFPFIYVFCCCFVILKLPDLVTFLLYFDLFLNIIRTLEIIPYFSYKSYPGLHADIQ